MLAKEIFIGRPMTPCSERTTTSYILMERVKQIMYAGF